MTLNLPKPIELYFAAENSGDTDALAHCFAADGTVLDEGRTLKGRDAIRAWNRAAKATYGHRVEPQAMEHKAGTVTVRGKVSGNFPGSPAILSFNFQLAGEKIAHLEIG
jgi:hypothetical protein